MVFLDPFDVSIPRELSALSASTSPGGQLKGEDRREGGGIARLHLPRIIGWHYNLKEVCLAPPIPLPRIFALFTKHPTNRRAEGLLEAKGGSS